MNYVVNNHNIWEIIIVTFIVSFLLVLVSKKVAAHIGAIDEPNARKVHKVPMPRLGGFGIFGAFLLSLAFLTGCASTEPEVTVTKSESPSLQTLILQGRNEEAKNLFITKINVNETDIDRNTALHQAASRRVRHRKPSCG